MNSGGDGEGEAWNSIQQNNQAAGREFNWNRTEGGGGHAPLQQKVEVAEEIAGNPATAGEALIKLKPSREIYKPPSLRKSRSGHQGRPKAHHDKNFHFNQHHNPKGKLLPATTSSGCDLPNGVSANHNSHHYDWHPGPEANPKAGHDMAGIAFRKAPAQGPPLNVNAKEFQIRTSSSSNSQRSQGGGGPEFKNNWNLQNFNSSFAKGGFPLVQSKSSGAMFTQFQKYCREQAGYSDFPHELEADSNPATQSGGSVTPVALQQSKSNGNLMLGRPHVRFLDESPLPPPPIESQMTSLKIEAKNSGHWSRGTGIPNGGGEHGVAGTNGKPQLMKSKSMLYKTHFQASFESTPPKPPFGHKTGDGRRQFQGTPPDWSTPKIQQSNQKIVRSKSFGYGSRNLGVSGPPPPRCEPCWEDFQIHKWPKGVVESVKVAMNGEDRVPARHKIDMVTRIFGTILGDYEFTLTLTTDPVNTLHHFVLPAVHIFLYFIQRENDETVMESFLNNCLATYQNLFQGSATAGVMGSNAKGKSKSNVPKPLLLISYSTTSKWIIFLKLLSTFYQKTKIIQKPQQRSVEEFRHRLLGLLCDSCLVVLRLSPLSYTSELVDTLFLVMTSLGRDMETTFPLKMKSILAGVRDVLVGVGASSSPPQGLPPPVHKTLMQLIELHAANWQLPASAVRYYYASIPSNDQSEA